MIKHVDIIFGLCWGDEGKGKITYNLSKNYDYVCRWNGGSNAGHTIYKDGKMYKTHLVPSGIFNEKKCVIGPNCIVHPESFYKELEYLKGVGVDINLIKIAPNAHVITDKHIEYDKTHLKEKLGTTGKGIAPCYSDKMLRCGILAKDAIDAKYIWDGELKGNVLCEGAQSFWLDINFGVYPYVTSSETLPYAACSLGFSPRKIRDIIGVCKAYDTKSGLDPRFPEDSVKDPVFAKIIELGHEYGTTTNRKRKVNWLNLTLLNYAIEKSGCDIIYSNKWDVLDKTGLYKIIHNHTVIEFENKEKMIQFFQENLSKEIKKIHYSADPEKI